MESVQVAQSGEEADKTIQNVTATDEFELFVGDYLEFTAGPAIGTKGLVYYLDEELLRIQPEGDPTRLRDFETSIFEDENTRLRREQSNYNRFIDIAHLKQGNEVQTFTKEGEPVAVYKVEKVNEDTDGVVLKNDEDEITIEFTVDGRVQGIPRGLEFQVMRSQEPRGKPTTETEVAEEVEEEEEAPLIEDVPVMEEDEVIGQIAPESAIYSDEKQKNDFLEQERDALKPEQRTDPKQIQRIRRLMENCYQLRNDILEYRETGKAVLKPVTYETLAKLLQQTEFPLAKQVLLAYKTLYLDHTASHYGTKPKKRGKSEEEEDSAQPDPTESGHKEILLSYLSDAVQNGIAFLTKEFGITESVGAIRGQLPKLYTVLENFYRGYFQVMGPFEGGNNQTFTSDRDFFRMNPLGIPKPELWGLKNVSGANQVVSTSSIKKIKHSYMRGLKPRVGKYGDRKTKITGVIEQGDEAEVWLYILFPYLFLRDLGTTRSGRLSIDVGNGSTPPKTMGMILEEGGGIQNLVSPGAIVAIDPEGQKAGNIELQDWLMGQEMYGNGIGDLLPYLRSIGLDSAEFTPFQQEVLLKKIMFYQANLVKFLKETRKAANEIIQNPAPVQNFSLLNEEEQKKFLESLIGSEDILAQAVGEFKLKYPSWQANDMGIFSFVYTQFPDYVLASLSGQPSVAEERKRVTDDRYLKRVHEALLYKQKLEESSEPLEPNNCDHVKNLSDIRKTEDDDKRIQLMVKKFIPMFKGKTEDNWLHCRVCKKHLLCEHEYLMILERTHPLQKETIHKKIILNFSDGVFNGKYICGTCGQPIQDLEFDQHLEFDDEGRVMMGNEPLTEEMENTFSKEIDKLLDLKKNTVQEQAKTAAAKTGEKAEDVEQQERFVVLNELMTKVGVSLPLDSFKHMMEVLARIISKFTKRDPEKYAKEIAELSKQNPKATFPTYVEYKSQDTIVNAAAAFFIEAQSAIPPLTFRSVVTGCGDPTFEGFPLIQDETQEDGLVYLSCVVASLLRNEKPWGETAWVKMTSKEGQERRKATIQRYIKISIQNMLLESDVQMLLEKKREYIVKEKGIQALTGRYADEIPSDFFPLPIVPSEELLTKAKAPLVGDAASASQKSFAWLLEAYRLAKNNGVYEPGNPLSEATCCYSLMKTPANFWSEQKDLPSLPPKLPPRGPRGSMLFIKSDIRKMEQLLGKPNPELMYRLFLRVCFPRKGIDNPRVGLPHEPGYDNKCPYCQFEFPIDPRLPPPQLSYSKVKKIQKRFDEEYQTELREVYQKEISSLQAQGAIEGASVGLEDFETLLRDTNRHFLIPGEKEKHVATNLETIDGLLTLETEPFKGFLVLMSDLRRELLNLTTGGVTADSPEVRLAYGPISQQQSEFTERLRKIMVLGKEAKVKDKLEAEFTTLWNSPPQVLGEQLRTFLLLPLQRFLVGTVKPFDIKDSTLNRRRKAIYRKIGEEDRKKLMEFLTLHTDQDVLIQTVIEGADVFKPVIRKKIEEFVGKLTIVIPLLIKVLRANVVPFGTIGLPYIQRAILSGMFWEFINPSNVGGKYYLRDILNLCLIRGQEKDENTILTPEEIQKRLKDNYESEKVKIIQAFDKMTIEEKRAELITKALGMGRWSRAGKVMTYDEEQQLFEARERENRGVEDFYGMSEESRRQRDEEMMEVMGGYDNVDRDGEDGNE